jgi:hypothetical protein
MQTNTTLLDNLIDVLNPNSEEHNKVHDLVAIWITDPVLITPSGKKARWTIGDKCRIEDGEMVDFKNHNQATHIISSCKGNVNNSVLLFIVVNIETKVLSELKIK